MVVPTTKDRPVYVFKMMERIGIESSGRVLSPLELAIRDDIASQQILPVDESSHVNVCVVLT
jgi:hypothetical protein